jgi:hypothetical protein
MTASQGPREVALITGASSGIGADIARELAREGHDLVLTARRVDRLQALKAEIEGAAGVRVHLIAEDLGTADGAAALIRRVDELGLPISFLVNNAGFGIHGDFLDNDAARLAQMQQLNMVTPATLTWHFGRAMRARGRGRILQIASIGAFQPTPYYAAYSATKAYLLSLSEAVRCELRGSGVTVTTICPGLTATEFHEVANHPKTGLIAMTNMTSLEVARIAVRAAQRGRGVVTPGLINWLTGLLVKLVPRSVATVLSGMLVRK